jgi:hypothetical protein
MNYQKLYQQHILYIYLIEICDLEVSGKVSSTCVLRLSPEHPNAHYGALVSRSVARTLFMGVQNLILRFNTPDVSFRCFNNLQMLLKRV